MNAPPPIAVLGLYNSGSTALAGALHRLGVHLGAPFWYSSDDSSKDNYYEPWDLVCQLRYWWNEPDLRENTDRSTRIACLSTWLRLRRCLYRGVVGAKHPLLCLSGDDLLAAWESETLILRACRPPEESIARLKARSWFPHYEDRLQRILWQVLEGFCARQPHLPVEYQRLKQEPAVVLREVAAYARLSPTVAQMAAAVAFIDQAR
jgi:hypothetical protein